MSFNFVKSLSLYLILVNFIKNYHGKIFDWKSQIAFVLVFIKIENFICKNHHIWGYLLLLCFILLDLLFLCQILHYFENRNCCYEIYFWFSLIAHRTCYRMLFFKFFLCIKEDLLAVRNQFLSHHSFLISMNIDFIRKLVFYFFEFLYLVFLTVIVW